MDNIRARPTALERFIIGVHTLLRLVTLHRAVGEGWQAVFVFGFTEDVDLDLPEIGVYWSG